VHARGQLSRAGWEPITHARSESPGILLERFGALDRGDVYVTVLNDGDETADAAIALDMDALGNPTSAEDLIQDRPIPVQGGSLTLTLAPSDLAVLRLIGAG